MIMIPLRYKNVYTYTRDTQQRIRRNIRRLQVFDTSQGLVLADMISGAISDICSQMFNRQRAIAWIG